MYLFFNTTLKLTNGLQLIQKVCKSIHMSDMVQRSIVLSYRFQNRAKDKDIVKKSQENQNSIEYTAKNKNLYFISATRLFEA